MNEDMYTHFRTIVGFNSGNNLIDQSVYDYLIYGLTPGSFTRSVLENNFFMAACHADIDNYNMLGSIGRALGTLPIYAWGSPERVSNWLADVNNCRTEYSDPVVSRAVMMKLQNYR